MSKKKASSKSIVNRRAQFDYALDDDLVVGIMLSGAETKNLRMGHGQLRGAYVVAKDNELWLVGLSIHGSNSIPISEEDVQRSRKLLAKRKQIDQFIAAKKQGLTIVPKKILTEGRYVKVVIAAGRGKKNYDKRATIKKREEDRSIRKLV